MNREQIRSLLEEKVEEYNSDEFVDTDPIQIPHHYSSKEDIEISGFLTATIAWGQRKTIIKNAHRMMVLMENEPFKFILESSEADLDRFNGFVHRTFNAVDLKHFIRSLKNIYKHHGGLEHAFSHGVGLERLENFRKIFFSIDHEKRTGKHVASPVRGSSAKRLNMMLRWYVRKDDSGVDLGIWNSIDPKDLYIPLDIHTGNTARYLGLLKRKQNDWKAVEELTAQLRKFDPDDPIKYDFALFGLGVFENLNKARHLR